MSIMALTPLLALLFASAIWLLQVDRHRLENAKEILGILHPRETDRIEKFVPPKGFDFVSDDAEFWIASDGWDGLLRKRHNAKYLVRFCQHLKPTSKIDKGEVRIMTARAIMVTFFISCSVLEFFPRLFIRDFPHFCGRTATQIYWDMERRATTLCSMYRPDLLEHLYEIL
jgi:hypothetical protein